MRCAYPLLSALIPLLLAAACDRGGRTDGTAPSQGQGSSAGCDAFYEGVRDDVAAMIDEGETCLEGEGGVESPDALLGILTNVDHQRMMRRSVELNRPELRLPLPAETPHVIPGSEPTAPCQIAVSRESASSILVTQRQQDGGVRSYSVSTRCSDQGYEDEE